MTRPLALSGFLPAWDVERRTTDVESLVAWVRERLGCESLESIHVDGAKALELARTLSVASAEPCFRTSFHSLLRTVLPELPWDRVWVQTYAHFRILVPGDERAVVRSHTDYGFAHGLDERNVWIALTPARGDDALHILPFDESMRLVARSNATAAIYDVDALAPVDVDAGDVILFTPLHVHGARPPVEHTRVSIDVRLVPAKASRPDLSFSPLRAAS